MQEYIFQGHTSRLSKTEAKRATHYLSNYRDKNINQPDKIRISFTAGIKISYKSLNKHLLKKPHLIKGPHQFKVSPKKISSHGWYNIHFLSGSNLTQWSRFTKVFVYNVLPKQTLQIVWTEFLNKLFLIIVKNLMHKSPL